MKVRHDSINYFIHFSCTCHKKIIGQPSMAINSIHKKQTNPDTEIFTTAVSLWNNSTVIKKERKTENKRKEGGKKRRKSMTKHKQVHKVCYIRQVFVQVEICTCPIKTLPTNLNLINTLLFIMIVPFTCVSWTTRKSI
jgi:hypothetical protein